MCSGVCTCVCTHVLRTEVDTGVVHDCAPCILRQGLSLTMEVTILASQAGQVSL